MNLSSQRMSGIEGILSGKGKMLSAVSPPAMKAIENTGQKLGIEGTAFHNQLKEIFKMAADSPFAAKPNVGNTQKLRTFEM